MTQCTAVAHPVERNLSSSQCMRQAKMTVAGKEYCTQHGRKAEHREYIKSLVRSQPNTGPISI